MQQCSQLRANLDTKALHELDSHGYVWLRYQLISDLNVNAFTAFCQWRSHQQSCQILTAHLAAQLHLNTHSCKVSGSLCISGQRGCVWTVVTMRQSCCSMRLADCACKEQCSCKWDEAYLCVLAEDAAHLSHPGQL